MSDNKKQVERHPSSGNIDKNSKEEDADSDEYVIINQSFLDPYKDKTFKTRGEQKNG